MDTHISGCIFGVLAIVAFAIVLSCIFDKGSICEVCDNVLASAISQNHQEPIGMAKETQDD